MIFKQVAKVNEVMMMDKTKDWLIIDIPPKKVVGLSYMFEKKYVPLIHFQYETKSRVPEIVSFLKDVLKNAQPTVFPGQAEYDGGEIWVDKVQMVIKSNLRGSTLKTKFYKTQHDTTKRRSARRIRIVQRARKGGSKTKR